MFSYLGRGEDEKEKAALHYRNVNHTLSINDQWSCLPVKSRGHTFGHSHPFSELELQNSN